MYYIIFFFGFLLSLLPLRIHYVFSDLLYVFIYKLFSYRTDIVRKNLTTSFPEKTPAELKQIEHRFYHWFCDYLVETVKMLSMSKKQIKKRMKFDGIEQINNELRQGHSVTVYLGHYCNWEWVTSLGLHIPPGTKAAQLYHPIENKAIDRLFLYSRSRYNACCLEMKEAFSILREWKQKKVPSITGYISDQVPGYNSMHYWPMFLNHDTPAYTGAERIARILDTPVYYFDIYRPKRGYYTIKVTKICDEPNKLPKFSITEQYYRLLENSIRRSPEFWLWSHNRWKRTREEFNALFSEEERKRILNKL